MEKQRRIENHPFLLPARPRFLGLDYSTVLQGTKHANRAMLGLTNGIAATSFGTCGSISVEDTMNTLRLALTGEQEYGWGAECAG
jgi:hypothetical protein